MAQSTALTSALRTIDTPANLDRLTRFCQIEKSLSLIQAAKLPDIEGWALKQQMGYHLYEDMGHADALRTRCRELPGGRNDSHAIDPALWRVMEACLFLETDLAFCSAVQLGFKPMLVDAYREHLKETTVTSDRPSREIIERIVEVHEQQIAQTRDAIAKISTSPDQRAQSAEAIGLVRARVVAAGGILGEGERRDAELPAARGYVMVQDPRREPRQRATFEYAIPEAGDVDPKVVDMFTAFFREMAAAESVAQVLWEAPRNMPWEFFVDTARHCWDEIRHCQAGQERLESMQFNIWDVPVQTGHYRVRARMHVLERYALLTQVQEKGAFPWKHASERHFRSAGDNVSADMVAYDIVDETAHVKFGVKWIPQLQQVLGDLRQFDQLVADAQVSCQTITDELRRQDAATSPPAAGY